MSDQDVTVVATFKGGRPTINGSNPSGGDKDDGGSEDGASKRFIDIPDDAYYTEAVD